MSNQRHLRTFAMTFAALAIVALDCPSTEAEEVLTSKLHPLARAVSEAEAGLEHIHNQVRDYQCLVVRRERINGKLGPHEYFAAKVRHRRKVDGEQIPFSIYLKFLGPDSVKGREVLYVEGKYEDKLLVRNGGKRFAYITTRLAPTSHLAMKTNRYPLTEFGVENLLKRLVEVGKEEIEANTEAEVEFLADAKINDRECTAIEVLHAEPNDQLRFHKARVYVDSELQVPIHFEAYDWPTEQDGRPVLLEQYTYTRMKINVGLTDLDFDPANPDYRLGSRK